MRNVSKLIVAACLATALSQPALAMCGYFQISAVVNNIPPTASTVVGAPDGPVSLQFKPPYTPAATSWSFGTTLPEGTSAYVTDICLQDKYVNYFSNPVPGRALGTRNSYLVIQGLWTGTSIQSCHFSSPLLVPPGFQFKGFISNGSPEAQNMIGLVLGYAYDSEECLAKFRQ